MPKFTFFYRGGKPKNSQEAAARQPGWDVWLRSLGNQLVDRGAPARSLGIAGSTHAFSDDLPPTTGYSVVNAASEEEAMKLAESCPIYQEGGAVEVAKYIQPTQL